MEDSALSLKAEILNPAIDNCNQLSNELHAFPDRKIKPYRISENVLQITNLKIRSVLSKLVIKSAVKCELKSVSAEAALILGPGGGVNHLKCLMSDGRIRNYIGSHFAFVRGFGASVSATRNSLKDPEVGISSAGLAAISSIRMGLGVRMPNGKRR